MRGKTTRLVVVVGIVLLGVAAAAGLTSALASAQDGGLPVAPASVTAVNTGPGLNSW